MQSRTPYERQEYCQYGVGWGWRIVSQLNLGWVIDGGASTGIDNVIDGLGRQPEGTGPFVRLKYVWQGKIKMGF
jgi:hypothetical protein